MKTDEELSKAVKDLVEFYRVEYEKGNDDYLSVFEAGEITEDELSDRIKDNYNDNFNSLKSKLIEIKIDDDYVESDPMVLIADIFPLLFQDDEGKSIKDFVADAGLIQEEEGYFLENSESVEEKIHQTISVFNDSIVINEKIGSLIDYQVSSTISGVATEELAWIKAYQIILSKMPDDDKEKEIEYLKEANGPWDMEKKIRVRINAYQRSNKMHIPFSKGSFSQASGGEADVHTLLPDGSDLIIAANKLVDNQMEGTQTVRHPMMVALKKRYSQCEIPNTEIFDEFCRKILGMRTFNENNLNNMNPFLKEILDDGEKCKGLRDEYEKIHIHTFQTYTQPKYSKEELKEITIFDKPDLDTKTKEVKLSQIQATIQFQANNINNKMVERRVSSANGKQKSDAAGTAVDGRALTWRGVTSMIDSYINLKVIDSKDINKTPIHAVVGKMTEGSLPQKAALATVLIDRVDSMSRAGSLSPSDALNVLQFLRAPEIGNGITSKVKFFSIDVQSIRERLRKDSRAFKNEGEIEFDNCNLSDQIHDSGVLEEIEKVHEEFNFEKLDDPIKIKGVIQKNNIIGYDYILDICNSIESKRKNKKTKWSKIKSFFN